MTDWITNGGDEVVTPQEDAPLTEERVREIVREEERSVEQIADLGAAAIAQVAATAARNASLSQSEGLSGHSRPLASRSGQARELRQDRGFDE